MIVDFMIFPRRISSTDGHAYAASKISEEPGFTDFFQKLV